MSEEDIMNCKKLLWFKNRPLEALKLWNIGKEIRVTFSSEEETILKSPGPNSFNFSFIKFS